MMQMLHSGQRQVMGSFSKGVPGGIPCFGSALHRVVNIGTLKALVAGHPFFHTGFWTRTEMKVTLRKRPGPEIRDLTLSGEGQGGILIKESQ